MGRRLRIEYYGAMYHIIQRGYNKEPIFKDREDKSYLLEILSETKEIHDFQIFAYVIMNNHYHFAIRTFNIPISRIMHIINTRYAKYYNSKMDRTGPVFEDRYTGILVQDESYLITLIKYIHNNPVAAKICGSMEEYQWSSDVFYRVNMESIVDIEELLGMLSINRIDAIKKYIELMDEDIGNYQVLKDIYERSPIIGREEFIKSMEVVDGEEEENIELDEILMRACPSVKEYELIKEGSRKRYLTKYKKKYIEEARQIGYSYQRIGKNIGISATSVRKIK